MRVNSGVMIGNGGNGTSAGLILYWIERIEGFRSPSQLSVIGRLLESLEARISLLKAMHRLTKLSLLGFLLRCLIKASKDTLKNVFI